MKVTTAHRDMIEDAIARGDKGILITPSNSIRYWTIWPDKPGSNTGSNPVRPTFGRGWSGDSVRLSTPPKAIYDGRTFFNATSSTGPINPESRSGHDEASKGL